MVVSLMAVTHLVTPCGLLPPDILQRTQTAEHSHLIKYWYRSLKKEKSCENKFWCSQEFGSWGMLCPNKLNQTRVGITISNEQPSPLILGICCWYEVNVLEKWITLLIAHNIHHTPHTPRKITASIIPSPANATQFKTKINLNIDWAEWC